jgi:hypothetical protein
MPADVERDVSAQDRTRVVERDAHRRAVAALRVGGDRPTVAGDRPHLGFDDRARVDVAEVDRSERPAHDVPANLVLDRGGPIGVHDNARVVARLVGLLPGERPTGGKQRHQRGGKRGRAAYVHVGRSSSSPARRAKFRRGVR